MNQPDFEEHPSSRASNAWKLRALLGMAGQALVLGSTVMNPDKSVDAGVVGFSACNLLANLIALHYGASRKKDIYEESSFRQEIIHALSSYKQDINDSSLPASEETPLPLSSDIWDQLDSFVERHASRIGIGLRYFGALNMLYSGIETQNQSKIAGAVMALTGKTLAMLNYTHSPYNPASPDLLESVRQYGFQAGSLLEASAYGLMAKGGFDRFQQHPQRKDQLLFGMGQSVFVGAYLSRLAANFEELEIDMPSLVCDTARWIHTLAPQDRHHAIKDVLPIFERHFAGHHRQLNHEALYTYLIEQSGALPQKRVASAQHDSILELAAQRQL